MGVYSTSLSEFLNLITGGGFDQWDLYIIPGPHLNQMFGYLLYWPKVDNLGKVNKYQ